MCRLQSLCQRVGAAVTNRVPSKVEFGNRRVALVTFVIALHSLLAEILSTTAIC